MGPAPDIIMVIQKAWGQLEMRTILTGVSARPLRTRKYNFGFLKNNEFLDQLSVYWLIEEDPAQ